MIRLKITVEGPTEQKFVKEVLAPYLAEKSIFAVARSVLTSKDNRNHKEYRGGLQSYQRAKNDITAWIKEESKNTNCYFSTMFDFYALPATFPCYDDAKKENDPYQSVDILEKALAKDIGNEKFVPYIQLHEFESLIFADPSKIAYEYLDSGANIQKLIMMVGNKNPELLNCGVHSAPSKRILANIPQYDKHKSGAVIVKEIGIDKLRECCLHFHDWLTRLEGVAG